MGGGDGGVGEGTRLGDNESGSWLSGGEAIKTCGGDMGVDSC